MFVEIYRLKGNPKIMKNILRGAALILCAACMFTLASCVGDGNIDTSADGIIGDNTTNGGTSGGANDSTRPDDSHNTNDMTGDDRSTGDDMPDVTNGDITDDNATNGGDIMPGSGDDGDINIGGDDSADSGMGNSIDPRLGITTDGDPDENRR